MSHAGYVCRGCGSTPHRITTYRCHFTFWPTFFPKAAPPFVAKSPARHRTKEILVISNIPSKIITLISFASYVVLSQPRSWITYMINVRHTKTTFQPQDDIATTIRGMNKNTKHTRLTYTVLQNINEVCFSSYKPTRHATFCQQLVPRIVILPHASWT